MDYKYLILDFGNVLAYPVTGNWFITERFMDLIDMKMIDNNKLYQAIHKYGYILSRNAITLEDEEKIFYDFYKCILKEINYQIVNDNMIKELSNYFTYNLDKYKIYEDVVYSLDRLSKCYILLLLSDNWPCGIEIMKHYNIDKYFTKMYISSVYGTVKEEGIFFDYPINEFDIKQNEALFIDDNERILDVAIQKGLDVKIMKRNKVNESKYSIITSLNEIK